MSVVGRILLMFLAYVLACIAASAVFTTGALSPHWDDLTSSGLPPEAIWAIIAVGTPIIGAVAALPTVLAIAEGFAWRSVLLYAAFGGVLALALSSGLDLPAVAAPDAPIGSERQRLAASGIAAGLVYWLFAGRSAGFRKRST